MRHLVKLLASICSFLIISYAGNAQNFNYTFSKDSVPYTLLTDATQLAGITDWSNQHFGLKLPFQFNAGGYVTDSITIQGNGYIDFAAPCAVAIVSCNSFTCNKDTNNAYTSLISYESSGSTGNRILKIQFTNLSQTVLSDADNLDYQIWLIENGNHIEFHFGPNSYTNRFAYPFPTAAGIINKNMNTTDKGYMIGGSQFSPSGQLITGDSDFVYLNSIPSPGIILRLIPTF